MIDVKNLSKHYGKKVAVDNLSFTISDNKVTGFLGPNGAGKSTTLRLMLGFDHGSGVVTFDNQPLNYYPQPARLVGFLLEPKSFHPTRTARNHLRIIATSIGIEDRRVDEVLDLVDLKKNSKDKPGKFSLGMSQRLAIAVAILANPQYLLLDEPANGLDPEGVAWLRTFLQNYVNDKHTVFISSHILSEMALIAQDLVLLNKGSLLACTSVDQLIANQSQDAIYIRVKDNEQFRTLLQANNYKFKNDNEGFIINQVTSEALSLLANQNNNTVLELREIKSSLEDAYLSMLTKTTPKDEQ